MKGQYSEQQKESTMKYMETNLERIQFRVCKGKKAKIQELAESMDMSVSAMLEYLINKEAEQRGFDLSVPPTPSQIKKSEQKPDENTEKKPKQKPTRKKSAEKPKKKPTKKKSAEKPKKKPTKKKSAEKPKEKPVKKIEKSEE